MTPLTPFKLTGVLLGNPPQIYWTQTVKNDHDPGGLKTLDGTISFPGCVEVNNKFLAWSAVFAFALDMTNATVRQALVSLAGRVYIKLNLTYTNVLYTFQGIQHKWVHEKEEYHQVNSAGLVPYDPHGLFGPYGGKLGFCGLSTLEEGTLTLAIKDVPGGPFIGTVETDDGKPKPNTQFKAGNWAGKSATKPSSGYVCTYNPVHCGWKSYPFLYPAMPGAKGRNPGTPTPPPQGGQSNQPPVGIVPLPKPLPSPPPNNPPGSGWNSTNTLPSRQKIAAIVTGGMLPVAYGTMSVPASAGSDKLHSGAFTSSPIIGDRRELDPNGSDGGVTADRPWPWE